MVRVATLEDFDVVYRTSCKSDPRENSYWVPTAVREELAEGFVLIDDETSGVLEFHPGKKNPSIVTIYNIMVPREHQGKGAGRRLMEKLSEMFPSREILARCPATISANSFYEHLGMTCKEVLPPDGRRRQTLKVWVWGVERSFNS